MRMSTVALILGAWIFAAIVLGLLLGRVLRLVARNDRAPDAWVGPKPDEADHTDRTDDTDDTCDPGDSQVPSGDTQAPSGDTEG